MLHHMKRFYVLTAVTWQWRKNLSSGLSFSSFTLVTYIEEKKWGQKCCFVTLQNKVCVHVHRLREGNQENNQNNQDHI